MRHPATHRHRRPAAAALVALAVGVAPACTGGLPSVASQSGGATTGTTATTAPAQVGHGPLAVTAASYRFVIAAAVRDRIAQARPANARAGLEWYLAHRTVRTPRWSVVPAWTRSGVSQLLAAIRNGGASVAADAGVAAVQLRLPVVKQVWRNNCEAAALSMMLDGRVSQQKLQRLLPVARPYTMQDVDGARVWGDPNLGFVGPANGGGYGVYHGPLLALARRFDPGTTDLTGTSVNRVVDALRHGRPVVAWIQLGRSLPVTWRTPAGVVIHANWAEHAVTLTGWRPGVIVYNNPWTGTTEQFTIAGFTQVWQTLGDQAIAGTSVTASAA